MGNFTFFAIIIAPVFGPSVTKDMLRKGSDEEKIHAG